MTTSARLIEAAEGHVGRLFKTDSSGHDWWHLERVRRLADYIADREGGDRTVVTLAALLHDIEDWKFAEGSLEAGPAAVAAWLRDVGAGSKLIDDVATVVGEVSFKGAGVATVPSTLEGKIVQDADRLDAIGAIGIARAFAFGGSHGRLLHDPAQPPAHHPDSKAYQSSQGPTLNHFYEKLLLLRQRLHTETAKRLARDRHRFMEEFVNRFLEEWKLGDAESV